MPSKFWIAILAVAAALGGVLAASYVLRPQENTLQSGSLLPQPRALPEFSLSDQDGKPFTRAALLGHWSLVFPGFTHCPDVCPTTLAYLKTLRAKLDQQNKPLSIVFLSVDPERDHGTALAAYLRYFNPAFIGVTAPEPELSRVAQALLITYVKVPGATADSYSMDHSAALVLINPQAQVAGFFTPPFQLEPMAADLAKLIETAL